MSKQTPRSKALELLQKLCRLEACDDNGNAQCWSCRKFFNWKEMDGGHYIPKGHSSYWSLKKDNVHPQCKGCNSFGMRYGTANQEYTKSMIDFYGREFVDAMEKVKRTVLKISKAEYLEMISDWKAEIKKHLTRIGEK